MRNVTYRCAATGFSKFNRNYFMPLTPSTNAQAISDMGTFSFPMMDGETVVPVQVTDDTLEYMASRDHTHLDEPADLFDQYRGEVEAAASTKYDKGHEPGQAVIVTVSILSLTVKTRPQTRRSIHHPTRWPQNSAYLQPSDR
jgi:Protein of unknown function (DUF1488)